MICTKKLNSLKRPEKQEKAVEKNYQELYYSIHGENIYKEPDYSLNENSIFQKEVRKLIDSIKDTVINDNVAKDKIEQIYTKYFTQISSRGSIIDLKHALEELYFIMITYKKGTFDNIISNIEFECLDGAIGKILDLKSTIDNDPKKLLFNAKFEVIKQLAIDYVDYYITEDDYYDTANPDTMHIHHVHKLLSFVSDEYKTIIEKTDTFASNNEAFLEFKDIVDRYFSNGIAAKMMLEIMADKLLKKMHNDIIFREDAYNNNEYRMIYEILQKTLKDFGLDEELSEMILGNMLNVTYYENGNTIIQGYKNNAKEIMKCGIVKHLQNEGYFEGLVLKDENEEFFLLGDSVYNFDNKYKSYSEYLNLQGSERFSWGGLSLTELISTKGTNVLTSMKNNGVGYAILLSNEILTVFLNKIITKSDVELFKTFSIKKITAFTFSNVINACEAGANFSELSKLYDNDLEKFYVLISKEAIEAYKTRINGLDFDALKESEALKIVELISPGAIAIYKANINGLNAKTLKVFAAPKIKALTSLDPTLYKSGPSFLEISSLYDGNMAKFYLLTSKDMQSVYKSGVKFSEISWLYDNDIMKLRLLTSANMQKIYKAGITFLQVSIFYEKVKAKLAMLDSEEFYIKYQPYINESDLKRLKEFNIEKIIELISIHGYKIEACNSYIERLTIESLKEFDMNKMVIFTSNIMSKAYEAGITFSQLSALYHDDPVKFGALSSYDAITVYMHKIDELNFDALKVFDANKIAAIL